MPEPRWSAMSERERDALIATKIFGTLVEHLTQREARFTNEEGEEEVHELLTGYVTKGKFGYEPIPHYTTSIDAAWQVVERVTRPIHTQEELIRAAKTDFTHWFDSACLWVCTASEAAELICINALRVTGEVIE